MSTERGDDTRGSDDPQNPAGSRVDASAENPSRTGSQMGRSTPRRPNSMTSVGNEQDENAGSHSPTSEGPSRPASAAGQPSSSLSTAKPRPISWASVAAHTPGVASISMTSTPRSSTPSRVAAAPALQNSSSGRVSSPITQRDGRGRSQTAPPTPPSGNSRDTRRGVSATNGKRRGSRAHNTSALPPQDSQSTGNDLEQTPESTEQNLLEEMKSYLRALAKTHDIPGIVADHLNEIGSEQASTEVVALFKTTVSRLSEECSQRNSALNTAKSELKSSTTAQAVLQQQKMALEEDVKARDAKIEELREELDQVRQAAQARDLSTESFETRLDECATERDKAVSQLRQAQKRLKETEDDRGTKEIELQRAAAEISELRQRSQQTGRPTGVDELESTIADLQQQLRDESAARVEQERKYGDERGAWEMRKIKHADSVAYLETLCKEYQEAAERQTAIAEDLRVQLTEQTRRASIAEAESEAVTFTVDGETIPYSQYEKLLHNTRGEVAHLEEQLEHAQAEREAIQEGISMDEVRSMFEPFVRYYGIAAENAALSLFNSWKEEEANIMALVGDDGFHRYPRATVVSDMQPSQTLSEEFMRGEAAPELGDSGSQGSPSENPGHKPHTLEDELRGYCMSRESTMESEDVAEERQMDRGNLTDEMRGTQSALDDCQINLNKAHERIKSLEDEGNKRLEQIEGLEDKIRTLEQTINAHQNAAKEPEQRPQRDSTAELRDKQIALDECQAHREQSDEKIKSLKNEAKQRAAEISQLNAKILTLKERIALHEGMAEQLKHQVDRSQLTATRAKAKAALVEARSRLASAGKQENSKPKEEGTVDPVERINGFLERADEVEERMAKYDKEVAGIIEANKDLQEQIDQLRKDRAQLEEETRHLKNDLEVYQQSGEEIGGRNIALEKELRNKEEELRKKDEEIKRLEEELKKNQRALGDSHAHGQQLKQEAAKLEEEIQDEQASQHRRELERREERIAELELEVKTEKHNARNERDRRREVEENGVWGGTVGAALQSKLDEVNREHKYELEGLESEIKALKDENGQLQATLASLRDQAPAPVPHESAQPEKTPTQVQPGEKPTPTKRTKQDTTQDSPEISTTFPEIFSGMLKREENTINLLDQWLVGLQAQDDERCGPRSPQKPDGGTLEISKAQPESSTADSDLENDRVVGLRGVVNARQFLAALRQQKAKFWDDNVVSTNQDLYDLFGTIKTLQIRLKKLEAGRERPQNGGDPPGDETRRPEDSQDHPENDNDGDSEDDQQDPGNDEAAIRRKIARLERRAKAVTDYLEEEEKSIRQAIERYGPQFNRHFNGSGNPAEPRHIKARADAAVEASARAPDQGTPSNVPDAPLPPDVTPSGGRDGPDKWGGRPKAYNFPDDDPDSSDGGPDAEGKSDKPGRKTPPGLKNAQEARVRTVQQALTRLWASGDASRKALERIYDAAERLTVVEGRPAPSDDGTVTPASQRSPAQLAFDLENPFTDATSVTSGNGGFPLPGDDDDGASGRRSLIPRDVNTALHAWRESAERMQESAREVNREVEGLIHTGVNSRYCDFLRGRVRQLRGQLAEAEATVAACKAETPQGPANTTGGRLAAVVQDLRSENGYLKERRRISAQANSDAYEMIQRGLKGEIARLKADNRVKGEAVSRLQETMEKMIEQEVEKHVCVAEYDNGVLTAQLERSGAEAAELRQKLDLELQSRSAPLEAAEDRIRELEGQARVARRQMEHSEDLRKTLVTAMERALGMKDSGDGVRIRRVISNALGKGSLEKEEEKGGEKEDQERDEREHEERSDRERELEQKLEEARRREANHLAADDQRYDEQQQRCHRRIQQRDEEHKRDIANRDARYALKQKEFERSEDNRIAAVGKVRGLEEEIKRLETQLREQYALTADVMNYQDAANQRNDAAVEQDAALAPTRGRSPGPDNRSRASKGGKPGGKPNRKTGGGSGGGSGGGPGDDPGDDSDHDPDGEPSEKPEQNPKERPKEKPKDKSEMKSQRKPGDNGSGPPDGIKGSTRGNEQRTGKKCTCPCLGICNSPDKSAAAAIPAEAQEVVAEIRTLSERYRKCCGKGAGAPRRNGTAGRGTAGTAEDDSDGLLLWRLVGLMRVDPATREQLRNEGRSYLWRLVLAFRDCVWAHFRAWWQALTALVGGFLFYTLFYLPLGRWKPGQPRAAPPKAVALVVKDVMLLGICYHLFRVLGAGKAARVIWERANETTRAYFIETRLHPSRSKWLGIEGIDMRLLGFFSEGSSIVPPHSTSI
ncbi:hypothetical protein EsH8_III_001022 [Colletotrichum jinshuiense]